MFQVSSKNYYQRQLKEKEEKKPENVIEFMNIQVKYKISLKTIIS